MRRTLPHKALGKIVQEDRDKKHMSIRDYAHSAGIKDHTLVLRLESGQDVRLSAYLKLAKKHGLPLEALEVTA